MSVERAICIYRDCPQHFLLDRPHQTQSTAIVLAVGEADTSKMIWVEMDECSAYQRYKVKSG